MTIVRDNTAFFPWIDADPKTGKPGHNGKPVQGFYLDPIFKNNVDNFLIRAVEKKFDGVVLFTGAEGTGKTTFASALAAYVDPTFPGPLINEGVNEGTPRRRVDRIVYTPEQINHAIDTASVGQAIVIDEAIMAFGSQDAGSDMQKLLIKKFVTIRKKRLYLFLVIPSIFFLRKYFAIFRTRAMCHCIVDEELNRGQFKFYSHSTKRKLYIRGMKEFDMACVEADFRARFINTEGYFYHPDDYDKKKEAAIKFLSQAENRAKLEKNKNAVTIKGQRDCLIVHIHRILQLKEVRDAMGIKGFGTWEKKDTADFITKTIGEKFAITGAHITASENNMVKWLGLSSSIKPQELTEEEQAEIADDETF